MAVNIHDDNPSFEQSNSARRISAISWFYFFLTVFLWFSAICFFVMHQIGFDKVVDVLGPGLVFGFIIIPLSAFLGMILTLVLYLLEPRLLAEEASEFGLTAAPCQIILENDDFHTFQFVMAALRNALGCTERKAFEIAENAHRTGRAVAWLGSREEANQKIQLLRSFRETSSRGEELGPLNFAVEHRFHVVLLNDDDHSYAYVIRMLEILLGHSPQVGFALAKEVDTTGRVIVATTTKERAEVLLKRIHAFGLDPSVAHCRGSMSARIEPAE